MGFSKKTARQVELTLINKNKPELGSGEYKLWSFSTSLRNPSRLGQILDILARDKKKGKRIWDKEGQNWLFKQLQELNLYASKTNLSVNVGLDGRGRTAAAPVAQLGFIEANFLQPIQITPMGELYMDALKNNNKIIMEDYLLLSLSRLRLIENSTGDCSHVNPKNINQGKLISPLLNILNVFLDNSVLESGGISTRRASYIIPLATNNKRNKDIISLTKSKKFSKDFLKLLKGNINTAYEYGDTLTRYLINTGLFIKDASTGKGRIAIAPGREQQARRLRDYLIKKTEEEAKEGVSWEKYRKSLTEHQKDIFPWHGSTEDYIKDCNELVNAIYSLTGEVPDYHLEDNYAHIKLRQMLGDAQEVKYISSGQNISDFNKNLLAVQSADKPKANGKFITPLAFEAAVLKSCTAFNNIKAFLPNYLKDYTGNPIAHAPGNDGDGWIIGESSKENKPNYLLIEASLIKDRSQAMTEWQPAIRHLLNKANESGEAINPENKAGILVLPSVHEDTITACARDLHCLHLPKELRSEPIYLLPLNNSQLSRLLENVVYKNARLVEFNEFVLWIKNTCIKLGKTPNLRNPEIFNEALNQEIAQWNLMINEKINIYEKNIKRNKLKIN